jgi:hypothetical protein
MKKVTIIFILIISATTLLLCSSGAAGVNNNTNLNNNTVENNINSSDENFIIDEDFFVSIYQADEEYIVDDLGVIELMNLPFALRFSLTEQFPYAYLTASEDDAIFDEVEAGKTYEEISYFGKYKVMAPYKDGYHELFLEKDGFHILYFDEEYEGEYLVKPLRTFDDDRTLLEWEISQINDFDNIYPIIENPYREIFLVIYSDINNDGLINEGEFFRFELHFTKDDV